MDATLDRHPIELNRDTFLKRMLALELVELDELQHAARRLWWIGMSRLAR